jgi:hypothetical protein
MMDDVLLSLQDLLAVYPIVRKIEAEQLALAIQRNDSDLADIQFNTNAIKRAAAESEAVTENAVAALKENDDEIEDARDVVVRAGLVADHLLVVAILRARPFVSHGGTRFPRLRFLALGLQEPDRNSRRWRAKVGGL